MDRWLINGEAMAELSIEDRGVAYGDGVFATIALRQHQCRLLDAHL